MPAKKLYVRGVVKAKKYFTDFLKEQHTEQEWNECFENLRKITKQVEDICKEHHVSPDDIPAPSKNAYYFLKKIKNNWKERGSEYVSVFENGINYRDSDEEKNGMQRALEKNHKPENSITGKRNQENGIQRAFEKNQKPENSITGKRNQENGIQRELDSYPPQKTVCQGERRGEKHETSYIFKNPEKDLNDMAVETAKKNNFNMRVAAEYYPYTSAKITGRKRNGAYHIRITHFLRDAPAEVKEAAVGYLICEQQNNPSSHYGEIFNSYVKTNSMAKKVSEYRKINSRKVMRGARGRCHDLKESFQRVNRKYFNGKMKNITLGWGRKSYGRLGHYDHAKKTIIISRLLDEKNVGKYVLDYLVYHEMLHREIRSYYKNGRRVVHSREFKRKEREFEDWEKAEKAVRRIASKGRRRSKHRA